MANFSFHFSAFISLVLVASLVIPTAESLGPLFIFGDSLFDAGLNGYIPNNVLTAPYNPPYGETYFGHPTGRVSDGRVVPDFIALFAKLPMMPPYLQPEGRNFSQGINFASAGASVLGEDEEGRPVNMHGQLGFFKEVDATLIKDLGPEKAKKLLMRGVYLLSLGGNDYFKFSTQHANATEKEQLIFTKTVIGNLTTFLREIYKMGGRKMAIQNVGALGCTPGNRVTEEDCAEFPLVLAQRHNRLLSLAFKKLAEELPGFKYSIFDYYNAIYLRTAYPKKYGFKVGADACCGSGNFNQRGCGTVPFNLCEHPSDHVWWDGAHTTEATNLQLAKLMWNGRPGITGPFTVKQLFQMF